MEMLYIKIFLDDKDALDTLNDKEKACLLTALIDYASDGVCRELDGCAKTLFAIYKKRIDRERRDLGELSAKRSACGKLGGRPRRRAEDASRGPEHTSGAPADELSAEDDFSARKPIAFSDIQNNLNKDIDKDEDEDINIDRDRDRDTDLDLDSDTDIDSDTDTDAVSGACVCPDSGEDICQSVYAMFNSMCPDLPKVKFGSPERERAVGERLAETGGGLDMFREAFRKTAASDFLCGRTEDGSGWKATFDWIIRKNNWTRILEGCYDTPDKSCRVSRTREVYAPTYDIGEIERQLDLEWMRQFEND